MKEKISRLFDVLEILFHRKGGFNYLKKPTRSLASFQILNRIHSLIPELGTVVDVGANQGQFAVAVSRFYPRARIYSFEPVPDTFQKLKAFTAHMSQIEVFNFGLGSDTGNIDFYQNEHSHASSALRISDIQVKELPETAHTHTITVPIKRLDEVAKSFHFEKQNPTLLKLDVQGFEKEVLNGAQQFIDQVDYLLFEASFVPMYEGEPLFSEMHAYVTSLGFRLMGPVGALEGSGQRILQMDMLYARL